MTPGIADFLLARIAEDEKDARTALIEDAWSDFWIPPPVSVLTIMRVNQHITRWAPPRALAECEAKRQIVEDHAVYARDMADAPSDFAAGRLFMARLALARLAECHADHPDYREEWRP